MFCPKCGSQNPDNSTFCANCGSPIGGNTNYTGVNTNNQPYLQPQPPKKKSKAGLIIGIIVGVLIFIVIVGNIGDDKDKNNKKDSSNSSSVSSESDTSSNSKSKETTTAKKTTTTVAKPSFNKGEEIWIKGKVSKVSNGELTLKDNDGFTWTVNCNNIDEFEEFESLLSGKDVKITGKVTGDLKVDFIDVELEGKTYTTANFSKEQFIANCVEVPYKDLARNPDDYKGKNIKVKIQISQVMSGGWFTESGYRGYEDYDFDLDDDSATYLKKEWYISYELDDGESKILEDDVVIFYGEFNGAEKMERALTGTTDYVPNLNAKYYEIVS